MLLHDGAYGTLLRANLHGDETVDDLCLREPRLVADAHRAYVEAGCDVVQTNAFLAHLRDRRGRRRRDLQLAAIDCARTGIASSDVSRQVLVAATIGPAGDEPLDFWHDLELVVEAGVDLVRIETVTTPATAEAALTAWADVARGVDDVELLLGCSFDPAVHPDARRGLPGWLAELAAEAPEEVALGLNCCAGPLGLRPALDELVELRGDSQVWVDPSAGVPAVGAPSAAPEWPLAEPDAWADAIAELVDRLPLRAVGGCCGTTPSSIAAVRARLLG